MKVMIDNLTVADATVDQVITIEGNPYFPPDSIAADVSLESSPTPYVCPWKGRCRYFNVVTAIGTHGDAAWAYPSPYASAVGLVGADFSDYIAFDRTITAIRELDESGR
ncbi:DUF427 domain-containing protein [Nocardioides sp. LHG3406-4]|uniref:DUF427 domain-containing protein n=1 Tax=Nocardioides sp. LHG3406-4 TaxID=2804575 RepID=UPI003CF2645C